MALGGLAQAVPAPGAHRDQIHGRSWNNGRAKVMGVDEGDGLGGSNQTMMMACHIVPRQLFHAADTCRANVMWTNETARYF